MKESNNPNVDEKGDFIFRWKLNIPKKKRRSKDPFMDFMQDIIKEILDIIILTYKGEDVKVNGFHFINSMQINNLYKRNNRKNV